MRYRFAGLEFDPERFELLRGGVVLPAQPKALALLQCLLRRHPATVPRHEIIRTLWPGVTVSAGSLAQVAHGLRRLLGDGPEGRGLLRTVRGRGYRLDADVERIGLPHLTALPRADAFVGREAQVAQLLEILPLDGAPRRPVALLTGEAGIGKSRTAQRLVELAATAGVVTAVGYRAEGDGAPAYWPWVRILRELLALPELRAHVDESDLVAIAAAIPEIGAASGATASSSVRLPPEAERFALHDRIAQLLLNAAQIRPLLLVLDDLQSADWPSLRLLSFLVREIAGSRLAILCTYRDADVTRDAARAAILSALGSLRDSTIIPLPPFTEEEAAAFVTQQDGVASAPERIAELHRRSGGNPLFLKALCATALEAGSLPSGIREAVSLHLASLPRRTRALLEVAAVFGREFDTAALCCAASLSPAELTERLDPAVAARVLQPAEPGSSRFRFAHVLISDVLRESLEPARRRQLHVRAADALEATSGDAGATLSVRAQHLFHGLPEADPDRVLRVCRRAASRALDQLAFEEAVVLTDQALGAAPLAGAKPELQADLLLMLSEAAAGSGDVERARRAALEAADRARECGDDERLARAALAFAVGEESEFPVPARIALLEEALRGGDLPDALRARVLARLAYARWKVSPRQVARELILEAVATGERAHDPAPLGYALQWAHRILQGRPDDIEKADRITARLRRLARTHPDVPFSLTACAERAWFALRAGRGDELGAALDALAREAGTRRQPFARWIGLQFEAVGAHLRGDLGRAGRSADAACDAYRQSEPEIAELFRGVQWVAILQDQGKLAGWRAPDPSSFARDESHLPWRCVEFLATLPGCEAAARQFLHHTVSQAPDPEWFDINWGDTLLLLADLCQALGDTEAATALYPWLLPWASQCGAHAPGWMYRGGFARALGVLAGLAGDLEAASAHFEAGLARDAAMSSLPFLARGRVEHAEVLLRRGERGDGERAQALLAEGWAGAVALGLAPVAQRAARLAASRP